MEVMSKRFIEWQTKIKDSPLDSFGDFLNYIKDRLECEKNRRYSPLSVSICITERCNLKCVHCYQKNSGNIMEIEKVKKILEDLYENNVLHLTITGGEPLTHCNIIEILKYAKELKFAITFQTNGTLLDDKIIKVLKNIFNNNIDVIQISLEGSMSKIHNKQRFKGFNEVIKSIISLVQNDLKVIINITPTKLNQDDIYKTFILADKLNVYGFQATPLAYLEKGDSSLDVDREKVIRQEYLILTHKSPKIKYLGGVSGEILHLMSIPEFKTKLLKAFKTNNCLNEYKCDAGIYKVHIGADYEVYPCVFAQHRKLSMGNLMEKTFREIWFEDYLNTLLFRSNRDLKNTKCEKCEALNICRGGCLGLAFEKYGNINFPDPRCEYISKGE
ncbi:hypothetical protein Y919_11035 [Caloranaerobacter azorensis H53214]|uniref:Radical SAM core domain-containing protein n=1 Tax=Caloranaerobacter azorensis H53214 TaxID=1156417 RepID=A0A096CSW4_9FIRM|nr:radical SAM protein [Caloranaerobacter azorensis]KGG79609.1 hypothetical protein Y919_11035 [Caloranaerobacter azorensis H53214]